MDRFEAIKEEYISGAASYRCLAAKYNIPYATLARRARDENWVAIRNEGQRRCDRLDAAGVRLISKLERAIEELDDYVTMTKTKEKSMEYDDDGKKVLCETIVESESLHVEKGVIDRAALKQLIAALSQLKGEAMPEETKSEAEGVRLVLDERAREFAV